MLQNPQHLGGKDFRHDSSPPKIKSLPPPKFQPFPPKLGGEGFSKTIDFPLEINRNDVQNAKIFRLRRAYRSGTVLNCSEQHPKLRSVSRVYVERASNLKGSYGVG